MKQLHFFIYSILVAMLNLHCIRLSAQPIPIQADTISQDLFPQTGIEQADKAYQKAQSDGRLPDMIKAYLQKAAYTIDITPDSAQHKLAELKQWASRETDPIDKSFLLFLTGHYTLETATDWQEATDTAICYFRKALANKEALSRTTAGKFQPLISSNKPCQKYMKDNLYQLLAQESIRKLTAVFILNPVLLQKIQQETLSILNGLIDYYQAQGMREALLLTKLDKLNRQTHPTDQGGVSENLRITTTEAIDSLRQWTSTFADSPICGEVYCQLANLYGDQGNLRAKLEAARTGWEKYPQTISANDLKEQMEEVTNPSLQVTCPFPYPNRRCSLKIDYRNLSGFTLELYRTDLQATSHLLESTPNKAFLTRHAKRVASTHFSLNSTPDFQKTDTLLTYTFPDEGIYFLKSIPDGFTDKASITCLHLSALQAVVLGLPDKKQEITVVDKLTGRPVAGAEVVYYRIGPNRDMQVIGKYPTNKQGSVCLTPPTGHEWIGMNACKPGSNYMKINYSGFSHGDFSKTIPDSHETHTTLYTDRSLYKPGQTVHICGISYDQWGDDMQVKRNTLHEIQLLDLHNQKIKSIQLKSDLYGRFYGNIVLPESLLPGEYRLTISKDATRYIRVDTYKRPTFEVTFPTYTRTHSLGDTTQLAGEARSFAGFPLANCKLTYHFSRTPNSFRELPQSTVTIASGEMRTDSEGRFTLPVTFRLPENHESKHEDTFYTFRLTVEVTSPNGETQAGEMAINIGKHSIVLQIQGLRSKVAREKTDSLSIRVLNLNGLPVKAPSSCAIYAIDKQHATETLKYKCTVPSHTRFFPEILHSLASGLYRMEVSATDSQGRVCRTEKTFTIFSLSDRKPPVYSHEWFYQDGEEWQAEKTIDLYAGSSEEGVYLFYDVFCGQRRIESKRITLNREIQKFSFPYLQEYGNGITVNFAFLREGKLYTRQVSLVRPSPKKEMQLRWKTFRNRLQPGAIETWELSIKSPSATQAALMATLYDASIDRLYRNEWELQLNFPRHTPLVGMNMLYDNQSIYLYSYFPFDGVSTLRGVRWWDVYTQLSLPSWWSPIFSPVREKQESRMPRQATTPILFEPEHPSDQGFAENNVIISVEECGGMAELEENKPYIPLRKNFAETAFFYPDLESDSSGTFRFTFQLPESITEWKFLCLAHTRDMQHTSLTETIKTVKPFMVQPNLPRFLRANDEATISTSIHNLSQEMISGTVLLELIDPLTEKTICNEELAFRTNAGQTHAASFHFQTTDTYPVLIARITACGNGYADGEQHYLPILPDHELITETMPVQLKGKEQQTIDLSEQFQEWNRNATDQSLTLELIANPQWFAIQALPTISRPTTEDALAHATAYYANSISQSILTAHPELVQLLRSEILQPEVHNEREKRRARLLQETPWMSQNAFLTEQHERLTRILDANVLQQFRMQSAQMLAERQLSDGSWSWFPDMDGNSYITTRITEMLARVPENRPAQLDKAYSKAVGYLHEQFKQNITNMQRNEQNGRKTQLSGEAISYLYICALDSTANQKTDPKACAYALDKLIQITDHQSIYERARSAQILFAHGKKDIAHLLTRSIYEYSVCTPEMGRYFDTRKAAYSPNHYRIPTHVAVMETLKQTGDFPEALAEMQFWLLKQKQVQAWDNSLSTADAIHAFLNKKADIRFNGKMEALVDNDTLKTPLTPLGNTSRTYTDTNIPTRVVFSNHSSQTAWGSIYAEYTDKMKNIRKGKGKQLRIQRTYYKGQEKVTDKTILAPGDKLTVVLTVETDRDMDFIRIKDSRAACLEPADPLSGYRHNGDIGYYQATQETSMEFFIDKLPKGTVQITYPVYVDRNGIYQTGTATVKSAYAPEFSGYSPTALLQVNPE